jgi:hypothetical protein
MWQDVGEHASKANPPSDQSIVDDKRTMTSEAARPPSASGRRIPRLPGFRSQSDCGDSTEASKYSGIWPAEQTTALPNPHRDVPTTIRHAHDDFHREAPWHRTGLQAASAPDPISDEFRFLVRPSSTPAPIRPDHVKHRLHTPALSVPHPTNSSIAKERTILVLSFP